MTRAAFFYNKEAKRNGRFDMLKGSKVELSS
jgi:hypothetical protein